MTSVAATQFLPVAATASAAKNSLIVSVHDVTPSNRQNVEGILSELAHRGVRLCSLLVVPDYHHQGLFSADRQFVSWLRELESHGHEVVIHGYFHERPRGASETFRDKIITRFYTQNEGEFYDLEYDEAFRRITRARDEFRNAGLTPRGFVAPAWLLSAEGERAARDADMEYTTKLSSVQDLRSGKLFPARSLVYSVRNNWRRLTSLAWNAALARIMKNSELLRVSIHPPDYLYPRIWDQIRDLVSTMEGLRTPLTYQDWVAEQRVRAQTEG